jgi:hypothetical protein
LVERGAKLGALDHLIKSKTTPAILEAGLERWLAEPETPAGSLPSPRSNSANQSSI